MAESQPAAGLGDFTSLGGAAALGSESETRRLSELRVIDLRAELKRRSLDSGGNKSVLMERLRRVSGTRGEGTRHPGPFPRPEAAGACALRSGRAGGV